MSASPSIATKEMALFPFTYCVRIGIGRSPVVAETQSYAMVSSAFIWNLPKKSRLTCWHVLSYILSGVTFFLNQHIETFSFYPTHQ